MTVNSPKVYYIQHPLADNELPEQTLATFTDEDVAEYTSEYEEYLRVQNEAVRSVRELYDTTREYVVAIFGEDSKQVRYLDRMVRNGESLVDIHAKKYPHPDYTTDAVSHAKDKYSCFLGQANAPKASGDETLQEINNAVSFLIKKGLELNSDFTISNAVSMARTLAAQEMNDSLPDNEEYVPASNYNLFLKDGSPFPSSQVSLFREGINLYFRNDDINWVPDGEVEKLMEKGANYTISFRDSDTPYVVVA
tara:strand:- start:4770 stop:5522 length:753 start_codon:yes stop_codon:yes gene_type:complete